MINSENYLPDTDREGEEGDAGNIYYLGLGAD